MSDENLLSELHMNCDECGDDVIYPDDYVLHLKEVHKIKKNFHNYLEKFERKIKGQNKRKVIEVIDIDDDDEDDNDIGKEKKEDMGEKDLSKGLDEGESQGLKADNLKVMTDEDSTQEEEEEVIIINKNIFQAKMESAASKAMEDLLKPLYSIINDEVAPPPPPSSDEPQASEEELKLKLDNIRKVIAELKIPENLLRDIVGDEELSLTEQAETPVKEPEVRKPVRRSERDTKKRLPKVAKVTKVPQELVTSMKDVPQTRLSETNSISPGKSTTSGGSGMITLFFCPLQGCQFSTDKQGLRNSKAAKHLSRAHKVTHKIMANEKDGKYKFKKVKQEIQV